MARWDRWGRQVLRDGDIVFRLGDARVGRGYFPMSRFLAGASNSKFSHTGIVAIEVEGPVVYDITRTGVARQPFCVWALDNIGSIGVKRLRPEYKNAIPKVLAYCRKVFEEQVPFDYQLSEDDTRPLLCRDDRKSLSIGGDRAIAGRSAWETWSGPPSFPCRCSVFGLRPSMRLTVHSRFDQLVYFPGNENHGIWSARQLMTVVPRDLRSRAS